MDDIQTPKPSSSTTAQQPVAAEPCDAVSGVRLVSKNKQAPQLKPLKTLHVLILNNKGGCGKTTISTNLASWLQTHAGDSCIVDNDPQQSSLDWQKVRSLFADSPAAIAGHKADRNVTLSWQLRKTYSADYVIYDAPAALNPSQLRQYINKADLILMPIMASAIDVKAATRFLQTVLLHEAMRGSHKQLAVISNRVKKNTIASRQLGQFLKTMRIPVIAQLSDSQGYVNACQQGKAIFELKRSYPGEAEQWQQIGRWVEARRLRRATLNSIKNKL